MWKLAIEVFNRYENKYLIDEKTSARLKNGISEYMESDAYNKNNETYAITNIYYDTNDSHLISTSLDKPYYKEKLRLRAYGTPLVDSKVYLEIKKKYLGKVNKRRSAIKLCEAYSFLETGILPDFQPYMNRQVLNEIQYLLSQHELKPKLYLSYERIAFFNKNQHDLRISFDKNIITRREDLKLESGIFGKTLLDEDVWLMEIKASNSMPIWLAHLLSEYKVYPVSFSKYGTEYKNTLFKQAKQDNRKFLLESEENLQGVLLPA
jgi:SPX domain-containing protein involved in vacuolar polyphosphate accumulation